MKDLKIFHKILKLDSLKPSKETNEAFSQLVSFSENSFNKINLKEDQILKLRELSSRAECEMELYWANRITESSNPEKELKKFWYYKNYEDLTVLEYTNVINLKAKIKKVLFVGGGPLPLTAIILANKYNILCEVLERDELSFLKSTTLIKSLGLENKVKIIKTTAEKHNSYGKYDLIYLAALVGENEKSKNKMINHIYKEISKNSLFLCRSSHGSRKIIYTPINKNIFKKLKPLLEVRPYNSIINSFFILQKN